MIATEYNTITVDLVCLTIDIMIEMAAPPHCRDHTLYDYPLNWFRTPMETPSLTAFIMKSYAKIS